MASPASRGLRRARAIGWPRAPQDDRRTKIVSIASGTLIVYLLPDDLVVDDMHIALRDSRLSLTDGRQFDMNLWNTRIRIDDRSSNRCASSALRGGCRALPVVAVDFGLTACAGVPGVASRNTSTCCPAKAFSTPGIKLKMTCNTRVSTRSMAPPLSDSLGRT